MKCIAYRSFTSLHGLNVTTRIHNDESYAISKPLGIKSNTIFKDFRALKSPYTNMCFKENHQYLTIVLMLMISLSFLKYLLPKMDAHQRWRMHLAPTMKNCYL